MNQKIKNYILNYYLKEYQDNIPFTDEQIKDLDSLIRDVLMEEPILYKELGSQHRWYINEFRVVSIDGMLIGYHWYHVTGDNSPSDMGLKLDLNKVCEVEEKEKTIKYYTPIKNE